jgi:hypothetical protein
MTFEEIVAGVETPIIVASPLGEPEEFVVCEHCERLVRARSGAWELHRRVTCELYLAARRTWGVGT